MDYPEETTDEYLLLAAGQGDLSAFEMLVLRNQELVWAVAYRFLRDRAEAEDIAQETFMRLLDAAPRYKATAAFRSYLYGITARLCLDHRRRKSPVYLDEPPDVADDRSAPDEQAAARERTEAILGAIAQLPPKQRMAVILKYYDDLRSSEIARAMDVTPKAVERLLARAREALKSTIGKFLE